MFNNVGRLDRLLRLLVAGVLLYQENLKLASRRGVNFKEIAENG